MKILVIIDAQKDFIDGSLGVGLEKWNKAKAEILSLIKAEKYDKVIYTKDWHPTNHCSFKSQGGLWPVHCVANTSGAEIDSDLLNLDIPAIIINKGQNADIEEYGVDVLQGSKAANAKLHLVGLCYDYCVSSCAKITVRQHPEAQVTIKRAGTVAIDEKAIVDFENLPIIVE